MAFILILLVLIVALCVIILIARDINIFDGPDIDEILYFIITTTFVIFVTILICMVLSFMFK